MKNTKTRFYQSLLALLVCISMLIGSTFAWFTDYVSTGKNIITSGNIDVEMYWTDDLDSGVWHNVEDPAYNTIFDYDNWEPGYTDVKYIKVVNNGSLALNYDIAITPETKVGELAEVIQVYYSTDGVKVADRTELENLGSLGSLKNVLNGAAVVKGTLMAEGQENPNHPKSEEIITLAMSMITTAGNNYQSKSVGKFSITALATQAPFETDSFGAYYDSAAELPVILKNGLATSAVEVAGGKTSTETTLLGEGISATVPTGVELEDNADRVTLTITPLEKTTSDIVAVNNEILIPVDVHIEGVSKTNNVPIIVNLGPILPKYMNMGNYTFIHVENGVNNAMTLVESAAELTTHNAFTYDPLTGEVSVAMQSFSEIVALADTSNVWKGGVDDEFAGAGTAQDPYIIANADQLAYMGDRISNDNGNYADKHYKLITDINIGGAENSENAIFYPIGYNKVGGSVQARGLSEIEFEPISYAAPGDKDGDVAAAIAGDSWYTYGGAFKGVFDGNGHTVSGIYQNTWAMKGDYDGHYYNDAMGLFGYVNGGTVKNLNIENFYSEGEYAPTGCITAYAAGSTLFENISIVDSHPQTYNTGVAGIVGWDNGDGNSYTFKNITVDATNTFSALWGSWDVAASGILGSLKNSSSASFKNCHVAATIDVYNDVCGNYQYYWYRYSGAFIGTVYSRLDNGNGALDLSKINATGCTVNFGNENDPRHEFYYCELTENSIASYTHDYQMSRISPSDIEGEGNSAKCKVHNHEAKGYETINGVKVLVEDKQAVYIPYRQLFGGYGWGVKGIDLEEYNEGKAEDQVINISDTTKSEEKFAAKVQTNDSFSADSTCTIGELFDLKEGASPYSPNVQVTVSPVGDDSTAGGIYSANAEDWKQGKLTFTGVGAAEIIISDYYFCKPTKVTVKVIFDEKAKFESKFTNGYTYRVGNKNAISVGSLFGKSKEFDGDITSASVSVTVNCTQGNVTGTYTNNATDWTKGTIQLSGTGFVDVTITDNQRCEPTIISLEVIDAVNATSASSASKNNVVLLNDVGFSTLEVSNGYTLYGNGFKMTAANDVMYDTMNAGFVVLKNGTLDNVQIICPNYSYSVIYNSNIKESGNTAVPSDTTNEARGNVRSAVMVDGESKIINSYVHGGRAAIFLRSGNLVIEGSTISGGAAANIHTIAAQSLTLRNATLIQKPFKATVHKTDATIMGFSGLFECGEDGNSTPLFIEGTLVQDAWINEAYKTYTPSAAESIVSAALSETNYLHDLDGDGKKESLNLGFTYIPQEATGSLKAENITDSRTDKNSVPYGLVEVSSILAKAKVYSYKNTNGTSDSFINVPEYKATAQGPIAPTVSFTDTNDDRIFETKFDVNDNRWESTLTVNLDNGNYTFNFDRLLLQKYNENLDYTVKSGSTVIDKKNPIVLENPAVKEYFLEVEEDGVLHKVVFILTATKTAIPDPIASYTTGGTPLLVVKSKDSDWSCAIPALEGMKVKYHDSSKNGLVELDFATLTPTSTGKQNGTNNYWETTQNGYKLKVSCGVIHDTKQVYGMPVVVDNNGTKQMYFVISSTNGYVSTGTSARAVTVTYEFTDPNGKTLSFTKSWNVKYADYKNKQYSYSDFVNGTLKEASSGGVCVTPDTLVTLANGTMKRIDQVTYADELLVWDFYKGEYAVKSSAIVMNHGYDNYDVVTLNFSDGTVVKTINGHGFFDEKLNKFVVISKENVEEFIGRSFIKDAASGTSVELVSYSISSEYTESWSILTAEQYNCILEGMLTITPAEVDGSPEYLMPYEIGEDMRYDEAKKQKDIDTYGLYTYEDFAEYATYEQFVAFGLENFKVSVGKGYITWNEILYLLEIHLG